MDMPTAKDKQVQNLAISKNNGSVMATSSAETGTGYNLYQTFFKIKKIKSCRALKKRGFE